MKFLYKKSQLFEVQKKVSESRLSTSFEKVLKKLECNLEMNTWQDRFHLT